jgi:hypothetical protein
MILVTGGVVSAVFQLIKRYVPENKPLRAALCWVFSVVVALAESWLAGDVLGLMGSWQEGTLTAEQVFGFGSAVFAAATVVYNAYYKTLKPRLADSSPAD